MVGGFAYYVWRLSHKLIPATGLKRFMQETDKLEILAFAQTNPGNGTETGSRASSRNRQIPFAQTNPGNGTETR
ncbi:hypothetical protein NIES2104_23170 [Leptolyngbya sp. NIES-2104]|nr:hypothetical protein NIES2104_23170 [Leptolyngbya sp. NIES-2104]